MSSQALLPPKTCDNLGWAMRRVLPNVNKPHKKKELSTQTIQLFKPNHLDPSWSVFNLWVFWQLIKIQPMMGIFQNKKQQTPRPRRCPQEVFDGFTYVLGSLVKPGRGGIAPGHSVGTRGLTKTLGANLGNFSPKKSWGWKKTKSCKHFEHNSFNNMFSPSVPQLVSGIPSCSKPWSWTVPLQAHQQGFQRYVQPGSKKRCRHPQVEESQSWDSKCQFGCLKI